MSAEYAFDLKKEVWELLPPHKRTNIRYDLIQMYCSELQLLNDELLVFIDQMRERVQMSCETIQLEWFLNKYFDPDFATNWPDVKSIYITNETFRDVEEYSYLPEEDQDPEYSYLPSEDSLSDSVPEFSYLPEEFNQVVNAKVYYANSIGLTPDQLNQIQGYLKRYIFLGKKYLLIAY